MHTRPIDRMTPEDREKALEHLLRARREMRKLSEYETFPAPYLPTEIFWRALNMAARMAARSLTERRAESRWEEARSHAVAFTYLERKYFLALRYRRAESAGGTTEMSVAGASR